MTREEAKAYRRRIEAAAAAQTDEAALESVDLFPAWKEGISVQTGERYRYEGKLYRVVQAHVTQYDWTPDATPALFTEVSVESWPEWKQPIGSEDAYKAGDKVSHNDKHWVSDVDGNVWEPGVYGWTAQA